MESKKDEIIITCSEGFLGLSAMLLLLWKQEWLILLFLCLLSAAFFLHRRLDRQKISRELSSLSDLLELILQGKPLLYHNGNQETLFDKINTQIVRIDEIHRANEARLKKEQDSTKQLLAELSHQLRTPLANMETYLALAEEEDVSPNERKTYLKSVEHAEQKIKFLAERYVLAARMENRLIQIHKFPQDMKQTAAEAIFQVYKRAEKKQIYIEMKEKESLNPMISHDRNWLCEAIYNLLDNSIKYSPDGSRVQVVLDDNDMFTEICVEDEGVGIEPGEENRIFQLYYRGSRIAGQEGYGMGMFISRQIVAAHDGFMRVKRKEQGFKVSIFLPKAGT